MNAFVYQAATRMARDLANALDNEMDNTVC